MKRKTRTILIVALIMLGVWSIRLWSAGNIKRTFGSATQIIGVSDGWITLSGTTEYADCNDVDFETSGYEGAHLIVEMDYDSTPTDEVKIKLYASLDGTNYDDTPVWEIQGDHDVDPQQLSFIVKDFLHWKIGAQQTGSTDSHNVRAYIQPYRWYYE